MKREVIHGKGLWNIIQEQLDEYKNNPFTIEDFNKLKNELLNEESLYRRSFI